MFALTAEPVVYTAVDAGPIVCLFWLLGALLPLVATGMQGDFAKLALAHAMGAMTGLIAVALSGLCLGWPFVLVSLFVFAGNTLMAFVMLPEGTETLPEEPADTPASNLPIEV